MKHLQDYNSMVGSEDMMHEAVMSPAAMSQKMTNLSKMFVALPKEALRISSGGATAKEQSIMDDIVECIKKKGLNQLMMLTTEAGTVALGAVCAVMMWSFLPVVLTGAMAIALNEMSDSEIDAIDEINSLMKWLEKKSAEAFSDTFSAIITRISRS